MTSHKMRKTKSGTKVMKVEIAARVVSVVMRILQKRITATMRIALMMIRAKSSVLTTRKIL